ncbi:MAG: winged helix-turn-helix transcriptional regulator [Sphaerospermopsis sp. SIO1G2]|nr:winged helix-turn-helix transcriptional regulator [Sphaerospermopsis sp. SIO1G2]
MTHSLSMQSLVHWYRICAETISQLPCELSMRQWAIFVHVYVVEDTHTVKSLAYTFDIPKPAVCRALDSLSMHGLVKRKKDQRDRRNVTIEKTMQGIMFLNQFNDILEKFDEERKKTLVN